MTDKQIIIDGTQCRYAHFDGGNTQRLLCAIDDCFCDCHRENDCYYKQLKRKEQECERLNEELYYWVNGEYCDNKCNVVKELDQLKAELDRANCQIADDEILQCDMREAIEKLTAELEQEKALKETYFACYKAKHEDIEGELFKLKAENEKLERQIEAERKDNWSVRGQLGEAECLLCRYDRTLTEIKEIAETCINKDICTFCDYSDRCYIEDEEIPTYDVCKLILEKISEVEE